MYSRKGMSRTLWNSIEQVKTKNKNLCVIYTKNEIHSKIYIWRKKGEVVAALIGSSNFSFNGLRNVDDDISEKIKNA